MQSVLLPLSILVCHFALGPQERSEATIRPAKYLSLVNQYHASLRSGDDASRRELYDKLIVEYNIEFLRINEVLRSRAFQGTFLSVICGDVDFTKFSDGDIARCYLNIHCYILSNKSVAPPTLPQRKSRLLECAYELTSYFDRACSLKSSEMDAFKADIRESETRANRVVGEKAIDALPIYQDFYRNLLPFLESRLARKLLPDSEALNGRTDVVIIGDHTSIDVIKVIEWCLRENKRIMIIMVSTKTDVTKLHVSNKGIVLQNADYLDAQLRRFLRYVGGIVVHKDDKKELATKPVREYLGRR